MAAEAKSAIPMPPSPAAAEAKSAIPMPPSPASRAAVPPPPTFNGRPPLANAFSSTSSSQRLGATDSVDSKEYLRDILNLSVDLDPDDDEDDASAPVPVSRQSLHRNSER